MKDRMVTYADFANGCDRGAFKEGSIVSAWATIECAQFAV
jgi:hypothetical protein